MFCTLCHTQLLCVTQVYKDTPGPGSYFTRDTSMDPTSRTPSTPLPKWSVVPRFQDIKPRSPDVVYVKPSRVDREWTEKGVYIDGSLPRGGKVQLPAYGAGAPSLNTDTGHKKGLATGVERASNTHAATFLSESDRFGSLYRPSTSSPGVAPGYYYGDTTQPVPRSMSPRKQRARKKAGKRPYTATADYIRSIRPSEGVKGTTSFMDRGPRGCLSITSDMCATLRPRYTRVVYPPAGFHRKHPRHKMHNTQVLAARLEEEQQNSRKKKGQGKVDLTLSAQHRGLLRHRTCTSGPGSDMVSPRGKPISGAGGINRAVNASTMFEGNDLPGPGHYDTSIKQRQPTARYCYYYDVTTAIFAALC